MISLLIRGFVKYVKDLIMLISYVVLCCQLAAAPLATMGGLCRSDKKPKTIPIHFKAFLKVKSRTNSDHYSAILSFRQKTQGVREGTMDRIFNF